MGKRRFCYPLLIQIIAGLFGFLSITSAFAHVAPESEFGHHIQLHISKDEVIVDYAIVLSDLALESARLKMETDGVPGISDAERTAYDNQQREVLRGYMELKVDGQGRQLADYFGEVQETPERVFVYKFSAPAQAEPETVRKVSLYNTIRLGHDKWFVYHHAALDPGIRKVAEQRWHKTEDAGKITKRQAERGIELAYQLGPSTGADSSKDMLGTVSKTPGDTEGDKLKDFIRRPLSLKLVVVALVISAVLGGLHALTPGHGKAVVAAYLVASKGRVIDAVFLGLVVTFTHTASVIALGLVALFGSKYFLPEDIAPWLSVASGLLISILGLWLLRRNFRQYKQRQSVSQSHGATPHTHDHHHDHGHHHHHNDHPHDHGHHHHHDHDHPHDHSHGHHHHHHGADGHSHSHVPDRAGFWGLLSLGISGGIVPCIDALVGLLFAISMNRIVWGLVILCAFSLGLAAVLVAIGVLMVLAKPIIDRFTGEGIWLQRLPIFSAIVVVALGTVLMVKALMVLGL